MIRVSSLALGVAATAFVTATPAFADYFNGNTLYEWCSTEPSDPHFQQNQSWCIGYIAGVVDGIKTGNVFGQVIAGSTAETTDLICMPAEVTLGQVQEVATLYLKNNPATRHDFASVQVLKAVMDAWPCKD